MAWKTRGEESKIVSNKTPKAGSLRITKATPIHIDNEARMVEAIPLYNPVFSSSNKEEV